MPILWQGKGRGQQVWSLGSYQAESMDHNGAQHLDLLWTPEANDNPDRLLSSDHHEKITICGSDCQAIGERLVAFLNQEGEHRVKHIKYWGGAIPLTCDLSRQPITDKFVDGRTEGGMWAIMSPESHRKYGRGLGTGNGQMYEKQADGRWKKVQG